MELSIIIPVFNEEGNIDPLIAEINKFESVLGKSVEVIFINDGSFDGTVNKISSASIENSNIKLYSFRSNLGKSACYNLGFKKANGNYIATMDGDLQDDPADLIIMLEKIKESQDFIVGWKHTGKSYAHKNYLSQFFNLFIRLCTKTKLHDINCPIRLFKKECIENIELTGEMFRFLPLLVSYLGFKVSEVKVKNLARHSGVTKFGFRRYFQGFFDFFTVLFLHKYKQKPMHFFGPIGLFCLFTGIGIDAFLSIRGIFFTQSGAINHFALLIFGVMLILVGLQILLFGFLTTLVVEKNKFDYRQFLRA